MPAPIPLPLRRQIVARGRRGQSAATIAAALGLKARTVRHLLRRLRQQPDRLQPDYRPGPGQPAEGHPLFAVALALRQQHPSWGAGFLRLRLLEHARRAAIAEREVPCTRTLQRWFARRPATASQAVPGPPTAGRATAACQPHDIWQMDAVEQLRLGSGDGACWSRLVDEYSGAVLATTVFPPLPLGARRPGRRPAAAAARLFPVGDAGPAARR